MRPLYEDFEHTYNLRITFSIKINIKFADLKEISFYGQYILDYAYRSGHISHCRFSCWSK